MICKFNRVTHEYTIGGVKVPSVSGILKPYDRKIYALIPSATLEKAGRFGTNVHDTIDFFLADCLDESKLDPALAMCLKAFKLWMSEHEVYPDDLTHRERPLYSTSRMYAGTPDIVWDKFEFLPKTLIDVKTRLPKNDRDGIQMAGYDLLLKENFDLPVKHYYVLYLDYITGKYKFFKIRETKERKKEFLYLLKYYQLGDDPAHSKKLDEMRIKINSLVENQQ